MASVARPVRKSARVSHGPAVLAAVIGGGSLDKIAKSLEITPKVAERALRSELRKRWIAPAQEYARLQIARLEEIANNLKTKAGKGDLPAIDRVLKVLDRLDRYHGFNKLVTLSDSVREDAREKLTRRVLALPAPSEPAA